MASECAVHECTDAYADGLVRADGAVRCEGAEVRQIMTKRAQRRKAWRLRRLSLPVRQHLIALSYAVSNTLP
eukprot:1153863-Rhodomonas_salina.1